MRSNPNKYIKMLITLLCAIALVSFVGCAQKLPKGPSNQTVSVDGDQRDFLLYIPDSYTEKTPTPLVFVLHGSGSSPQKHFEYSDTKQLADAKGCIAVLPAGIFESFVPNSWNTNMKEDGVDDIQMIRAIIEQLSSKLAIDSKRIYAAGFSGGARMISRAACELSDILAAIGPVAGVQFPEQCSPSRAMPIIAFHGKNDPLNHYTIGDNSRPYWTIGVEDSMNRWAENDQCKGIPQIERISDTVTRHIWKDCQDGAEVVLYTMEEGGHVWPDKSNSDIVASEVIWDFFSKHPLP